MDWFTPALHSRTPWRSSRRPWRPARRCSFGDELDPVHGTAASPPASTSVHHQLRLSPSLHGSHHRCHVTGRDHPPLGSKRGYIKSSRTLQIADLKPRTCVGPLKAPISVDPHPALCVDEPTARDYIASSSSLQKEKHPTHDINSASQHKSLSSLSPGVPSLYLSISYSSLQLIISFIMSGARVYVSENHSAPMAPQHDFTNNFDLDNPHQAMSSYARYVT